MRAAKNTDHYSPLWVDRLCFLFQTSLGDRPYFTSHCPVARVPRSPLGFTDTLRKSQETSMIMRQRQLHLSHFAVQSTDVAFYYCPPVIMTRLLLLHQEMHQSHAPAQNNGRRILRMTAIAIHQSRQPPRPPLCSDEV